MSTTTVLVTLLMGISCVASQTVGDKATKTFDPAKDILSLHYDHAPDRDDGHSAAADRTLLQSLYGMDWISKHVIPVSGAYGRNAKDFNPKSDLVMDAAWNDCGGWLSAHTAREMVLAELVTRWCRALAAGSDVWVKEGGQSDITAAVVERIRKKLPTVDTAVRIHVVQHGRWNERHTAEAALAYTKKHTHYIKIRGANSYLRVNGGDEAFVKAAITHPAFSAVWKAAFAYLKPTRKLDFSDTGELMHILGLGEISFDDFRKRFLSKQDTKTPNKQEAGEGK